MSLIPTTIRGRLMVLWLAASAPLLIIATLLTWRHAQAVEDRGRQRLVAALDIVQRRETGAVSDARRLLDGVLTGPAAVEGGAAVCRDTLRSVRSLSDDRYAGFVVATERGVLCRDDGLQDVPRAVAGVGQDVIASPDDGSALVPVAVAAGPGRPAMARAMLRLRWLVQTLDLPVASWAILSDGRLAPIQVTPQTQARAPSAALLARLSGAGPRIVDGVGQDGVDYVYAGLRTIGGLHVVLVHPAIGDLARADVLLTRQLVQLALLALLGVAIVTAGGELVIARPLARLARTVGRWQAGGRFEPDVADGGFVEVAALAHSFAIATVALDSRQEQLRVSAAQQELLMQEVHHRVKNNLQIIASLLNLQSSRIRLPAARAEFQAARDRIRALATVHRHLYGNGELHTINMRGFLEELCQQLLQALGETPTGGRIVLQIEAPELQISTDQAVPMALVVTESVSNAVKYAFPGGRSGHVRVVLAVLPDGTTARLRISDDGVGIPAGRAMTDSGMRDGIGLQLIRGFARQLGATLSVTEQGGTSYQLDIPLHRDRAAA